MKTALLVMASVFLAIGIMFYVLITNSERPTHMHFSTQFGGPENVVYYSAKPPEIVSQHNCDGKFTDVGDNLYETHVKLWQEKYGGTARSR